MSHLRGPNPAPSHGKLTDRSYLGSCVHCRHGIYQGQPSHRGRGQWLGILCGDCAHLVQPTSAT